MPPPDQAAALREPLSLSCVYRLKAGVGHCQKWASDVEYEPIAVV